MKHINSGSAQMGFPKVFPSMSLRANKHYGPSSSLLSLYLYTENENKEELRQDANLQKILGRRFIINIPGWW